MDIPGTRHLHNFQLKNGILVPDSPSYGYDSVPWGTKEQIQDVRWVNNWRLGLLRILDRSPYVLEFGDTILGRTHNSTQLKTYMRAFLERDGKIKHIPYIVSAIIGAKVPNIVIIKLPGKGIEIVNSKPTYERLVRDAADSYFPAYEVPVLESVL